MEKYKMVACALAFGLCSLISNAGSPEGSKCSGIENESNAVSISFNDETYSAQNAQAAPNRVWPFRKVAPAGATFAGRKEGYISTTLTLMDRPEVTNRNQLLRPENHLREVSIKRTELTFMGINAKTQKEIWIPLPIKNGEKNANKDYFQKINDQTELGYHYDYNGKRPEDFQTTGILTSNKPFIEGTRKNTALNVQAEGYFGHIIEKFNKLDGSKQKLDGFFRRNTGLNLGKDVELKWAKKGSTYEKELIEMENELKNSNYYWEKSTKGKSYLAWAGSLGIARDSSIDHSNLSLERLESERRNIGVIFGPDFLPDVGFDKNLTFYKNIIARAKQEPQKEWIQELAKKVEKQIEIDAPKNVTINNVNGVLVVRQLKTLQQTLSDIVVDDSQLK